MIDIYDISLVLQFPLLKLEELLEDVDQRLHQEAFRIQLHTLKNDKREISAVILVNWITVM